MSDQEKMPEPEPPEEERPDAKMAAVTRRQFLIGAGSGLVVGAVGAAGVLAATSTAKPAETTAKVPDTQPAAAQPAAQAVPDLPATMRRVTLNIDGNSHDVAIDVRMSLWEVLTYELGTAASNVGCDRAQCGACTVVIDGRAVNSCTVLAARLGKGQKILTVEGLGKANRVEDLHPIQKAYWQSGGFQCGICTRGFIMSTYALLTKNPTPNEDDIREALAGNICRCSEYPKIYESVFRAAEDMRKKA